MKASSRLHFLSLTFVAGLLAVPSLAVQAADSDLLLRYQFEETAGTKVTDSSGRGFDGTYVGTPEWSRGVDGRAFKLAGGAPDSQTASYVKIPNGVLKGLNEVTIATWVKWDGEGPWQWLYALGIDTNKYIFSTPKSGSGALFSAIKDGGERGINAPAGLENGVWHHVATTFNATTGKSVLYLDGAKVAETDSITTKPSDLYDAGKDLSGYIGKSFFPDPYFKGEVDDFRVYSKALTDERVSGAYGDGLPPAQSVALVKENLTIGRAVVSKDIKLPASSYGATIKWKSGNPKFLSDTGKVTRPAAGQAVAKLTLTATISKGAVTETKAFDINVLPVGYALKMESYNPIFKGDTEGNQLFTADPAVLVDGDTLYAYVGRDEAAIGGWFSMNQWLCYSTKDMVNWKYEGPLMKSADFSWGTAGTAWACHVAKRNGKYYFYSTTGRPDGKGFSVGVMVFDSPTGPFRDPIDKPLFDNAITTGGPVGSFEDIDPTVFIDDDGQAYIYWGNSKLHYALLNEDMISLKDLNGDGKITEGVDIFTDVPIKDMPGNFGEAPWLYKANGKYYMVYANFLPQKIFYAMSDSPRGPWQYKGIILDENRYPDGKTGDYNSDTSHPAVIQFKGQPYVFYHNAALPTGGQTRRSVSVEKMDYNPDGTIKRSYISSTGLTGVASRLQSYRHQDRFVRFSDFDLKLEATQDDVRPFQWETILGLADEATVDTVSIQSVSHPGYYIIVRGNNVVLAKNDGSAAFKKSATFRVVPGLADKSWVSLQSLADTKVYLRQSEADGKMKADVYSNGSELTDKQDATFRLVQN